MLTIRTLAASAALAFALAASAVAQTTPPTNPSTPATPKAAPPTTTAPATTPPAASTAPATTAPAASTAPPGGTVAPTGKTKKAVATRGPRSAESIACSKEADEKNIHGKPARPAFMKKCKADAAKAAKGAAVKKG